MAQVAIALHHFAAITVKNRLIFSYISIPLNTFIQEHV